MGKRRLSLQQKRRIASQQKRRQEQPSITVEESLGPPREGLVVKRYSKQADVLPDDAGNAVPFRCHIRANITDLVTGDRVTWREGEGAGIVESVFPRHSLMARPDARGKLRPLAANVDLIAIVFAPEPQPHQNLIDRYLVAAEQLQIAPLLLFNKNDLLKDDDKAIADLLALYPSLGLPVLRFSAKKGIGIENLLAALNGHTTVLVGQSGVGKSSILNRLLPDADAATGDLSTVAKGKHTTTASQFYKLPQGGNIIDSPGIREFGLWHLSPHEVARGFQEFSAFLGHCKYRDCLHRDEPHCAVLEAVKDGKIHPRRHRSYLQIINDLAQSQKEI